MEADYKADLSTAYFQASSLRNAIYLLNETDFRKFGSGDMRVQEADMSYKKQKEVPTGEQLQNKTVIKDRQKIKDITDERNRSVFTKASFWQSS